MIFTDSRLTALGIIHGTTGRALGNMRLDENVRALLQEQGIAENRLLRFKQVHSARIITVPDEAAAEKISAAPLLEADGWVLAAPGWGAAIITADCVPLFVWDETARVLGLAHCGWRGVAAGLPAQTIRAVYAAGGQGPLSVWVGAHIQSCCFEVQDDVAAQFPRALQRRGGKQWVDLNREITRQLTSENIPLPHIRFSEHCTCCEPENFFSYRREHTRDAMLSFVYLPPRPLH